MRVLERYLTPPHPCPYLEGREAKLDYSFAPDLKPDEYEGLMNSGHRKFGALFFKPVCDGCQACRPIRVPIETWKSDRSQRRAWKRNQDLTVRLGPPKADPPRLDLYNRYHAAQSERRHWPTQDKDRDDYVFSFVRNPVPAVEVSLWLESALLGVLIAEVTPNVVSAIYHYHDITLQERSLGTFLVLQSIELARKLDKAFLYLGFYVAGCRSMEYKTRFRPCETMGTDGVWRPLER